MAFEVLGQVAPSAGVLTEVVIVPADKQVVISSIFVCNQSPADAYFRIAVAQDGATDATYQYLYYNEVVRGNRTFVATTGITLPAGCYLRVYSTNSVTSFNVFGDKQDA